MMEHTLREFERRCLLQASSSIEDSVELNGEADALHTLVARGSYVEALKSSFVQDLIKKQREDKLVPEVTSLVSSHLGSQCSINEGTDSRQHTVLSIAIASLQLFAQSNFTGPFFVPDILQIFPMLVKTAETRDDLKKEVMEYIADDTEGIYPLIINPEYLALAKIILCDLKGQLSSCLTVDWWSLRCDMVIQTIADESSSAIYDRILKSISCLEVNETICQDEALKAQYHLEVGQAFLQFSDVGNASKHFMIAESILKLKFTLSGALGKRTKFQVDAKPQLFVKVEYENKLLLEGEAEGPKLLSKDLPKDILLNDDTRLSHIKFQEQDDDKVPCLQPVEQLSLLTVVQLKRRSCAADLQLKEETKAYLNALLQYPKCWVIQYNALRLRSLLESEESRAVDRALLQLEELVECVKREEPSRFERLKLFYASNLPAFWLTKQEYGKLLVQMGCTKTALALFEELQLWEDVIDCYNRIQMRNRSAEILLELLAKEETPKLWCLLGDATDEIEHYNTAWKLSKEKSSRAQRSLGDYHFHRKEYQKAIDHYTVSTKLNHLQMKVWQNLAYSAMQLEYWTLCCSAYKKCTVLEPDSFEFWNNLAKAYVHLKDMPKAFKCLQEAVRCKSDSWKMFENLMTVSASLGHFSESLFAYKRLLSLKPRHINILVISGMVGALMSEEYKYDFGEHFYKQLVNFLSELCQSCPSETDLWYYYGEAVSSNPNPTVESRDLACQHFRKSVATAIRVSSWFRDHQEVKRTLAKIIRLEKALVAALEGVAPETSLANVRSVAMLFDNVLTQARKGLTNVATLEVMPEAADTLQEAEAAQLRVKELITSLATSA